MTVSIFSYNKLVSTFLKKDKKDRPMYCRFQIFHRDNRSTPLFEIITNNSGCGRFVYDEQTSTYKQTLGICQFTIPKSEVGIRKALRNELRKMLLDKSERGELTKDEEEILCVLNTDARRLDKKFNGLIRIYTPVQAKTYYFDNFSDALFKYNDIKASIKTIEVWYNGRYQTASVSQDDREITTLDGNVTIRKFKN